MHNLQNKLRWIKEKTEYHKCWRKKIFLWELEENLEMFFALEICEELGCETEGFYCDLRLETIENNNEDENKYEYQENNLKDFFSLFPENELRFDNFDDAEDYLLEKVDTFRKCLK